MANPEPLLSVVVTSRNDDHGGSLLRRMQTFVNGLINQCKRHQLHAELLLVEWNPPEDRPRFAQALRWPSDPSPCEIRIIEVPPERHQQLQHAQSLPLFQMIAKNVGIRRARGKFILATNIDILFSDELIRFIASGQMQPGRMYRIDRIDVTTDVPVDAPVEKQLHYCENHLIRLNAREGTFNLLPNGLRVSPDDVVSADSHIYLGENWYPPERWEHEFYRWAGNDAVVHVQVPSRPPQVEPQALSLVMEPGPGVGNQPFELEVRDVDGKSVARGVVDGRQRVSLMLPLRSGRIECFTFHVKNGGQAVPFDARTLNYRIFFCGWAPAFTSAAALVDTTGSFHFKAEDEGVLYATDVAAIGQGIEFGRGIYYPERWNGEMHRWVGNNATLHLHAPAGAPQALSMELEPGPGVGAGAFQLQVKDAKGQIVAQGMVDRRQRVTVALPLEPGQSGRFILHTVGAGHALPGDTRVLNFRIFRCEWNSHIPTVKNSHTVHFSVEEKGALALVDIATPELGVRFGRGWYPVETIRRETFRWVGNEAGIFVQTPAGPPQALCFEMKPGPGVCYRPFELQVRDQQGQLVAKGMLNGRQRISLRLPLRPAHTEQFTFHVKGGGKVSTGDPRVLNFRVYRCYWSPASSETDHDLTQRGSVNFKADKVGSLTEISSKALNFSQAQVETAIRKLRILQPVSNGLRKVLAFLRNDINSHITSPAPLHTNACGDFTLMAREHWFDLRGYPEFEFFSLHIDSVMCFIAHHGGAPEEMLPEPMRIYHIEHGTGSGWTPEGAAILMKRITAKGIPVLDYQDLYKMATQMRRRNKPMIFNRKQWGMAEESLPETIIGITATCHEVDPLRIAA